MKNKIENITFFLTMWFATTIIVLWALSFVVSLISK